MKAILEHDISLKEKITYYGDYKLYFYLVLKYPNFYIILLKNAQNILSTSANSKLKV